MNQPTHSTTTILRRHQVAARTGLSSRTLHKLMLRNEFPQSFPLTGQRSVGWLENGKRPAVAS